MPPPRPADRDLGAVTVVPGFVDTHLHGGGGAQLLDGVAGRNRRRGGPASSPRHHHTGRVAGHRRARRVAAAGRRIGRRTCGPGCIAGIHLEGPWISTKRCGAHEPALMRDPDPERTRPGPCGRRRHDPDGHPRARARRRTGGDRADRRRGCRCGGGPYRGDLRTDPGGDRGRRDGGHAPVQRDAPDPPSRTRPDHCAAGRPAGDRRTDHRRRARRSRAVPARRPAAPVPIGCR